MSTLTSSSTLTVWGADTFWQATASFERPAEAMAFAARFPKSAGLQIHGANATSRATLRANGVNGGINESGVRRYWSLIRRAQQLGVTIEWHDPAQMKSVLVSQETFESAVFGANS
jgi:hypothetical protein